MADGMMFPDTVEEFMEMYKMVDTDEVYSNGTEYVPIFRMEQWFDHVKQQQTHEIRTETHGVCSDTISRQDTIEAIEHVTWYHQNRNGQMVSGANSDEHQAWYKAEDVYEAIEAVPSADRTGHWIKHGEPPWYVIECSECGAKWQMSGSWDANNFCGNCGADMRGEKDDQRRSDKTTGLDEI